METLNPRFSEVLAFTIGHPEYPQTTMVGRGVIIEFDFLAFLVFLHSTISLMKGIEAFFA